MIKLKHRTSKAVILEKMPQICEWVKLGHNIPSIHEALKDEGVITCGLSNFRAHYYQALKSETSSPQPIASTQSVVPKAGIKPVTKAPVVAKSAAAASADNTKPKKNEPQSSEPENNELGQEKTKRAFIGAPDLEMQVAVARLTFEEHANRSKRRRR